MKICLLSVSVDPKCGLGRMVSSIADNLDQRGYEVGLVFSEGKSKFPALALPAGFGAGGCVKKLRDLYRVRKFLSRYDVIVCYDMNPSARYCYLATLFSKSTFYIHMIGTYSLFPQSKGWRSKIKAQLMYRAIKKAKNVWPINDFVRRKIQQSAAKKVFSDEIRTIPVGVDTELFIKNESPEKEYAKQYILSVGAIKQRKSQLDSVKAFNKIKHDHPALKYLIVGSVSPENLYADQIKSYIAAESLEDKVYLIQNISDSELIDLYSGAEFFVLTPQSTADYIEGFGLVYIEAALCGLTSIGTIDTGAEAAILDQKTGMLVEQGNVAQIASTMQQLLTDTQLKVRLASAALKQAKTYDWERVTDLYEAEFIKLSV